MSTIGSIISIFMLCTLFLTACSGSDSLNKPQPPWQGIPIFDDETKTFSVKSGDEFILRYQIRDLLPIVREEFDQELLRLIDRKSVAFSSKSSEPKDSSVAWSLFKAIKPGDTVVTLKYLFHLDESIILGQKKFNIRINE